MNEIRIATKEETETFWQKIVDGKVTVNKSDIRVDETTFEPMLLVDGVLYRIAPLIPIF